MARKRNLEQRHAERVEEHALGAAFRGPDLLVESQAKAFERFDEVARRWLDRRREALDATRQSFEEIRDSSDFSDLVRIQQEWMLGSMRRLTTDLVELSGIALNLTQGATMQMARAAEGTAHDMTQAGRELASAAGSKPRTHTMD